MVIASDGPAGTGKSTVAKAVARTLGIAFLNSGSFYRAVTLDLLQNGIDMQDEKAVTQRARLIKMDYVNEHLILNGTDVEHLLHSDQVDAHAAQVSCIVELRHIINEKLRKLTDSLSFVCEGRDMTTVVFPHADYKFYLDASIDAQAERRFKQGVSNLSLEQIKQSIIERDKIDKNKREGALKIASDAHYIDTTLLTIEQVCEIIIRKIKIKG